MFLSKNKNKILITIIILLNVLFAAWFLLQGDILFHTDIARDFLLLEDIVKNKPLTLIGPRSGGIGGVFHGPLWLYLNLPAFVLGKGNPVVVGWFWWLIYLLYIYIVYLYTLKLFNKPTAVITTIITSIVFAEAVRSLFNPFGAVLLFPIFFYFFYQYFKSKKIKYLITSLFLVGLMIQFQIAFSLPILFLVTLLLGYLVYKHKLYKHLLSYFILLIPLSTYVVFELRHNFLQTNAVFQYLTISHKGDLKPLALLLDRVRGMFVDNLNIGFGSVWYLTFPFMAWLVYAIYKGIKNKESKTRDIYLLGLYFYFGFWILTFFFKGQVWSYYYWPFNFLVILFFAHSISNLKKKTLVVFLFYVLILNYINQFMSIVNSQKTISKEGSSWRFNYLVAKQIYQDAPAEFGYYIYSPDQFGYSPRYAINYAQDEYKNKIAYPYSKKAITYLIIVPPPADRPFLNGEWWKYNQVNMSRGADKVYLFPNKFKLEKYILNEDELKVSSDPNLIQDLHFR